MAAVEATPESIRAEVEEFSKLTAESGPEKVRYGISILCKREQKLRYRLDEARRASNTAFIAEGEKLLERVVETIGKLIDVGSRLAASPAATTAAPVNSTPATSVVSPFAAPVTTPVPVTPSPHGTPSVIPTTSPVAPVMVRVNKPAQSPLGTSPNSNNNAMVMDGPPEISPEEVKFDPIHDLIGEGAFGKVYRAVVRGKLVAVKVPTKQDLTEHQLRLFRHEVTVMRKVFHPNIVLFLGACTRPGQLMIVTELMKGDVEKLIHTSTRKLSFRQKLRIAYDAALGINWLHGICGIVHRDLKPANLLIDEQAHVKVTDFGFSEILRGGRGRDLRGPKGTALYMAPEVMRLEEYDQSADVHSFGLILYELATGHEPFESYTEIDPFVNALCYTHERPSIEPSAEVPESFVLLMKDCWHPQASKRPTFSDIVARLSDIIVDTAMPEDPAAPGPGHARVFWKKHFLKPLQESVGWSNFEELISKSCNRPPVRISKLQGLLALTSSSVVEPTGQLVTMERFHQFYKWFGIWFELAGAQLFDEMMAIIEAPWFHGDLSLVDSEERLKDRADGTFLVRLSVKDPKTPFTISSICNAKASHRRVYRLTFDPNQKARYAVQIYDGGEFHRFATMAELLAGLSAHGLYTPCPKNTLKDRSVAYWADTASATAVHSGTNTPPF